MRSLLFAVAAAAVLLSLPSNASAQADGGISGVVTNGTTGVPVAGTEVTLSRFERQAPESVDVTVTTDADGAYRFDSVETADGLVHAVSTVYEDVLYSSSMIQMNQTPQTTADLVVFETTTDQSNLAISSRALILTGVDRDAGTLALTDAVTFENSGDRTIVANDDGRTLRIGVPEVASQVSLRGGFDFGTASVEGTTVFATSAVRPGTSTPSLDYTIPYAESDVTLTFPTDYPTDSIRILAPAEGDFADVTLAATGVTLLDGGVVDIGGSRFQVWSTNQLLTGDAVELSVGGLPEPRIERNRLRTFEPAAIALLALVVASAATAWIVAQRGLALPRPITVAPAATATLEARRAVLADELQFLEEQHAQQHIDEDAYRVERRAVLEELRSISRQMRGIGDDE